MRIKTVKSVVELSATNDQAATKPGSHGATFRLNETSTTSIVIDVFDNPKRLVAWGMVPGDKVKVMMVRTASTGPDTWSKSDDCCVGPQPPGDVVVVNQMQYVRCGEQVVLTDQSPVAIIDDAGMYMLVYESGGGMEVVIDMYDDVIQRKTC